MIASVIPAKRLPRSMSAFDYEIPVTLAGEVRVGSIVRINFGRNGILGIVKDVKEKTEHQKSLKLIEKVEATLDNKYVDFLVWLADYYLSPITLITKTAVPELPKRQGCGIFSIPEEIISFASTQNRSDELAKIEFKSSFIKYDDWRIKIAAIKKLIELAGKKQILILSPSVNGIFNLYNILHQEFGDEVALLYDKMPKARFGAEWKKIISGDVKIVIGTRQAIFAPILNLAAIIIDDEESPDFKQYDQNPRYDARTAAEYLAKSRNAELIIFSELVKPGTFAKYAGKTLNLTTSYRPITIIDLKNEIKISRSILGERLIGATAESLQKGQKVVLFLNRRGIGEALYCRDCGHIPRCSDCGLQFKIHENTLLCHYCGKEIPIPLACNKCGSAAMTVLGYGTKKIERELKNHFPESRIERLDKDKTSIDKDFNILITTEIIFKKLFLHLTGENIGLVAALQFDPGKNLGPEGTFETLSLLVKLNNLSKIFDAEFVVQTPDPENKIFEYLANQELFYKDELEYRRIYKYPPFVSLIRLFYQDKDESAMEKNGQALFGSLRIKLLPAEVFTIKNIKSKIRGRYRFNIIIKVAPADLTKIREKLKLLVPAGWHIDVDPINLND